jgi:negative regulator of replication initiation
MERAISSSEFVNIDLNYIASSVAAIHSSAEDIERHLLNSDFDWREFHDTLDLIFF